MNDDSRKYPQTKSMDVGPAPYVGAVDKLCLENRNFRTALWTGEYLQMTLMNIPVGGEVGLEIHTRIDQYLQVVSGNALVLMGERKDELNYRQKARAGYGIFVPVDTWHNIVNIGDRPLKLISIYAPPDHPHGVVQKTKAEADAEENQAGFWFQS